MTILSANLRTLRKSLNCTQMAISEVLDIGFRTYVRYEAGERDAPISVLVKFAKLSNISLDRLLTTQITPEDLKIPDLAKPPRSAKNIEVSGGGAEEGRLMFKGVREDFLISTNNNEKNLLTLFRKMPRVTRNKFVLDAEWLLNNSKKFSGKRKVARKVQKAKNAARLRKMARSIKKITVKG